MRGDRRLRRERSNGTDSPLRCTDRRGRVRALRPASSAAGEDRSVGEDERLQVALGGVLPGWLDPHGVFLARLELEGKAELLDAAAADKVRRVSLDAPGFDLPIPHRLLKVKPGVGIDHVEL